MIYHFSGILFFTISFGTSTNFISLIPVPGAFNNLLPYQDEAFSEYRTESVQEFRFVLSEQIRQQVFYAIFVEKAETGIKSNAIINALKQLIQKQGYHL